MTKVTFDDKRLIPAPFVSINSSYDKTPDGEILGKTYEISLIGKILEDRGSPNSSGVFWTTSEYPPNENIENDSKLGSILRKQQALQSLFSKDNNGKKLVIQSADDSDPLFCFPEIQGISFPEDLWYNISDYSIALTANQIFPLDDEELDLVEDASESWTIEPSDEREEDHSGRFQLTYKINHNISAKGKRLFDISGFLLREPWENAKQWALSKQGINSYIVHSGIHNIPNHYQEYDYVKTEAIEELGGQYTFNESWTLSSGVAIESYEVSLTKGINQGVKNINIQGTIRGLDLNDPSNGISGQDRINNAEDKFSSLSGQNLFYIRSQNHLTKFSNGFLHSLPVQESISRNPSTGVLNYSFEYDNRPSGLIDGVLFEVINVNYIHPNESFASIFVLGRPHGPVLQSLETSEARQKTVNIELVKEPSFDHNNIGNSFKFPYNLISGLISGLDPMVTDGAIKSFKGQPNESYDPFSGRASFSLNWTYEV